MSAEIKSLESWFEFTDRTGKDNIGDYLNKGDIVSKDITEHILKSMTIQSMSSELLQFGETTGYIYDIDRRLKPLFATFGRYDNNLWQYYGSCFLYETINRD